RQQYVHATARDPEIADKVLAMLDEMDNATDLDVVSEPAYFTDKEARPSLALGSRLVRMKSLPVLVRAAWASCIAPATRGSIVRSPSSSCGPTWHPIRTRANACAARQRPPPPSIIPISAKSSKLGKTATHCFW